MQPHRRATQPVPATQERRIPPLTARPSALRFVDSWSLMKGQTATEVSTVGVAWGAGTGVTTAQRRVAEEPQGVGWLGRPKWPGQQG